MKLRLTTVMLLFAGVWGQRGLGARSDPSCQQGHHGQTDIHRFVACSVALPCPFRALGCALTVLCVSVW
jgi:hypothetical protein